MRVIGFDPGWANTAWAILDVRQGPAPPRATLFTSGTIETYPDESFDERLHAVIAGAGDAFHDGRGVPLHIAIENQRVGGRTQPAGMAVVGALAASAVCSKHQFTTYTPQEWHARVGVEVPPSVLKGHARRRKWIKGEVAEKIAGQILWSERLDNEHERDAAGVALCHILQLPDETKLSCIETGSHKCGPGCSG